MKACMAGFMAWAIELAVLAVALLLLKYEENKVYKRRGKE
jgi:hypothetical protein